MQTTYNYFNQAELPELILCSPDRTQQYNLKMAKNIKNTLRFNAISELFFNYAESYDGGVTVDPAYAAIKGKMLVYIIGIGYYIVSNLDVDSTGATPIKNATCYSLESEMIGRRLTGWEGTYQFATLLQDILDLIPTWSIGTIEASLLPLYRTFTSNNTTIYNFMIEEMEKAYGCIFTFNTINRTVSAMANTIPDVDTNISLSFDNLIKSTKLSEINQEICTALYCYGGNGLDIHYVNPLGSNVVYDFSYFKTTEWMTEDLIDALTVWEDAVTAQQTPYSEQLTDLEEYYAEKVVLDGELTGLNSSLFSALQVRDAIIEAGAPYTGITGIDIEIADLRLEIQNESINISSVQSSINVVSMDLRKIVHSLFFTSRISFDNFIEDVDAIGTSIDILTRDWKITYFADSPYPDFDAALLAAQTLTIETLLDTLGTQNDTLLAYLTAGFITYPPPNANLEQIIVYINQEVSTINGLYAIFQELIPSTTETDSLELMRTTLNAYPEIIYYLGNMTDAQYLQLVPYIYENTYTNNNIIITDIMTPVEIQTQSQYLYDQSIGVLTKVSQPRYEFSGSFANFTKLPEFASFTSELDVGKVITIQQSDTVVIPVILLELGMTYDDPLNFSMTFGNRLRLDNARFIYGDLLGTAAQLGSNI